MKKWTVGKPDINAANRLAEMGGLPPLCARVLVSRGIDTVERAADLLGDGNGLSDPFLITDMRKAAETIIAAVDEGKKICVYGDYDCDGITATVLLYSYLQCIGGDVSYYINLREEGYGLCADAVRRLAEEGTELIITVDNGISAAEEAVLVKELGMELVITDHHQPPEILPEAVAVVDPHRADDCSPFKDLCGCGLALKLVAAMDGGSCESALEQFSDLAAIATVADVVPLKGENREIVRLGLKYLENTENAGLKALMNASGIKLPVTATQAAFGLAPRINAAGRFASASEAAELLLCEDGDTAKQMAARLNSLNEQRKKAETEIMEDIHQKILTNNGILYKRVLFLYGEGWHHGVIGIVASRLAERFGKPVFILSEDGDFARGSARSAEGFSVHKALAACADCLVKFGGHTGAGGFTLKKEDVQSFDDALQKYAAEEYAVASGVPLHADMLLRPEELTVENVSALSVLEPYGEGNPKPVFMLQGARLLETVPLSEGKHTKLKLTYGNIGVYGLMFGTRTAEFPYKPGDMLDIMASAEINSYNGRTSVNLRIEDCRRSGVSQKKYFAAKEAYERYKRGEGADSSLVSRIVPNRDDLAAVYRAVPAEGILFDDAYFALHSMQSVQSESMNYCKFRLALDIFEELGLVRTDPAAEKAERIPVRKKADLESSALLNELKRLAGNTQYAK